MKGIPSIGFSLCDFDADADFSPTVPYVRGIVARVLKTGLPAGVCLNVNFPRPSGQGYRGSLASSPKQTVSDEEFSSSYTEYEQYLYDLAIESVSVSERLRHLLHSKVELISLKKLFTRTGHFHTAVAEFYLDKCLLLVEAEIELVNFGVQYPGTITTPSSFLSSLHWKGSLVNLMELISSLDYSGLITDESGKRLSFAGIVSAFEKLFNVAIPKPYDLRADLARRKKNYSVLLPKLKETFEKNIAACGNGK